VTAHTLRRYNPSSSMASFPGDPQKENKPRYKSTQHDPEKSYICQRCRSTWRKAFDQVEGDDICTIEESVEDLIASACGACQLLGTVMREHRKVAPALTEPHLHRTLYGDLCYVTFYYSGGMFRDDTAGSLNRPFLTTYRTNGNIDPLVTNQRSPPSLQPYPLHVNFNEVKSWINYCEEGHSICTLHSPESVRSLRLIDCRKRIVVAANMDRQYVALSYVWGNLGSGPPLEAGALVSQLPRTIKDSIIATRLLEYRYLWVDQYISSAA
jgi:hypothetical protein